MKGRDLIAALEVWLDRLPVLLAILVIAPLVGMAFYNQPSTDDFSYANLALQKGFWGGQVSNYLTWAGRYFSTFLLSMSPLVFHSYTGYKVVTILLILGFVTVSYWVSGKLLKGAVRAIFTAFFLVIFVLQVPDPDQDIFWMTGAVTYLLADILALILWGSAIEYTCTGSKVWLAACYLCVLGIVGSNETSMLLVDGTLGAALLAGLLQDRRIDRRLLGLALFALVLSGVVLAAPGNDNRGSFFPMQHHLGHSLRVTFHQGLADLSQWVRGIRGMVWIEIFAVATLVPLLARGDRGVAFPVLHPFWVVAFTLGLPFLGVFAAAWAMGGPPPPRAASVIYFHFLSALFILLLLLARWWKGRAWASFLPPGWRLVPLVLGLFLIATKSNSVTHAYEDLLKGRGAVYELQMEQRRAWIASSQEKVCVVQPILERPKTLYFEDITPDGTDWKNEAFSLYYGKPCVLARKPK